MTSEALPEVHFYSEVETDAFAARVSIASTISVFKEAVRLDPAYNRLLDLLRGTASAAASIVKHIALLSHQDVDPSYSNPADTALAVYVLALSDASPHFSKFAASLALRAQQTWWTRMVSLELLKAERVITRSNYLDPTSIAELNLGHARIVGLYEGDFRSQHLWVAFGNVFLSRLENYEFSSFSVNHTSGLRIELEHDTVSAFAESTTVSIADFKIKPVEP